MIVDTEKITEVAAQALSQAAVQANYSKPTYGVICKVFSDMHPSLAVEKYFKSVGFQATEEQVRHMADIIFAQRQNAVGQFYTKHFLPLLEAINNPQEGE